VRGPKKPRKGRHGLTAPLVLRSLVLMRVKNWDFASCANESPTD
jgi:transposase, IS5 family